MLALESANQWPFSCFITSQGPKTPSTPFGRIHEWLDMASGFTWDDPQKREGFEAFDLSELRRQVEEVEALCAAVGGPIVFGHNDLLAGNVMASEAFMQRAKRGERPDPDSDVRASAESDLTFIDFEYADWTPRGFDWGNHFNE